MRRFLLALWRVVTFPFRAVKGIFTFLNAQPEDRPLSDAFGTTVRHPSALLEHLEALRKHLFRMLIALAVCVALMFAFTPRLIGFLAAPIGGLDKLTAIDVTESVGVFMRVALLGAVALASPYIAFELWLFAAPGLRPPARKLGLAGIPLTGAFFVGGMAFTYKFMLPTALPFLLNFMNIQARPRVSSYVNFVTGLMFWIGVAFEFPLVVYVLSLMGIVRPRMLWHQWRLAVVIIAVVAAAVTPTVDPVNMALVMAPMIALYFISIGLSALAGLSRKNKEKADTQEAV